MQVPGPRQTRTWHKHSDSQVTKIEREEKNGQAAAGSSGGDCFWRQMERI